MHTASHFCRLKFATHPQNAYSRAKWQSFLRNAEAIVAPLFLLRILLFATFQHLSSSVSTEQVALDCTLPCFKISPCQTSSQRHTNTRYTSPTMASESTFVLLPGPSLATLTTKKVSTPFLWRRGKRGKSTQKSRSSNNNTAVLKPFQNCRPLLPSRRRNI